MVLFGIWESPRAAHKGNLEAVGVPTSVPVRVAHELLQAGHKYLDVRYSLFYFNFSIKLITLLINLHFFV